MLQLSGVKKSFSGRPIVHIPGFVFEPGFHWLQGANGSGKTTLLRIIAGLLPFEGDVLLGGVSLKKNGLAYRRLVSWAEAEPVYPAFICGREIISLYAGIRKAKEKQIAELASLFGAEGFLGDATGTYSSGMLKRLSLLLAFTGNPSLILLDEPLSTLDTGIADILPALMRRRNTEQGVSFIYSTHQPFPGESIDGVNIREMSGQTVIALT